MKIVVSFLILASISTAKPAPFFSGDKLGGGRLVFKDSMKPGRFTLVTFWATWCVACIEELKGVTEKLRTQPTVPLDIVTINVDLPESASDVKPTMKLYGFDFPVVLDPKHEIFSRFQNDRSLPFSTLVSPSGEMVRSFQGYSETLFDEVKKLSKS